MNTDDLDRECPASFLPRRRKRKFFADQPMFDPPSDGDPRPERLRRLASDAVAENPNAVRPWPKDTDRGRQA